ncbi:Hypothetical protein SMAX5B_010642, partial [Scophthalmus maximus]
RLKLKSALVWDLSVKLKFLRDARPTNAEPKFLSDACWSYATTDQSGEEMSVVIGPARFLPVGNPFPMEEIQTVSLAEFIGVPDYRGSVPQEHFRGTRVGQLDLCDL